ncbi:MAG: serine--tRNA ligase [Candidatus Andersenbacteria bacterium]
MIDITLLRNEDTRQACISALKRRGVDGAQIDQLLEADVKWRELAEQVESLRAQKNTANEQIQSAPDAQRQTLIAEMREVSAQEKDLAGELQSAAEQRDQLWRSLPNILSDDVPDGGEDDFEISYEGSVKQPESVQRDYLSLLGDEIDLERAAKVSGSRFVYIKGQLARLELALVSYVVDQLTPQGFTPVIPPVLVKEDSMAGMGYLDQAGKEEVYRTQDNLYLVGTSEQALGPMHSNEILDLEKPLRYVGISPCFRREAGSHGKDVKGILRLHQFDKVEMFSFTRPEDSNTEHEFIVAQQKAIMDALELPYRVVKLAAHDTGSPSAKTYDIQTWIPSERTYRETHSASNTTDYQARRLNIRTRTAEGKSVKAHLLNGTAIALSRILIAIIENHQRPDGSISIPQALHTYLPFTTIKSGANK